MSYRYLFPENVQGYIKFNLDGTKTYYYYDEEGNEIIVDREDITSPFHITEPNADEIKYMDQSTKLEDMMQKKSKETFLLNLSDKEASEIPLMYKKWEDYEDGYIFNLNDRVCYENKLYKCLQEHDKQVNREPDIAVSLWVIAYAEEYPEWKQPTGAHDAYNIDDKVTYNGIKYISLIDGNTTIPGTDDRYWEVINN